MSFRVMVDVKEPNPKDPAIPVYLSIYGEIFPREWADVDRAALFAVLMGKPKRQHRKASQEASKGRLKEEGSDAG